MDESHQFAHVALYGFNWLNMTSSGQKTVRKIKKRIILYTLHEKRKEPKLARKLSHVYPYFTLNIL